MELVEGAVIANRFRLGRQLGKGGMGSVWAAQHIGLDIACAVKFIHAEAASNPEARARFEREAKAAAQLRTPNVVQILDYGVSEGTPYIAMELLVGEPLSVRLQRRVRLDPLETLRIAEHVGRALTKAHAAGIVHRDLKPENIFLVPDEEGEIAKVLDFGVAKKTIGLTDSNTKTGALLGTPYYMSPEQAQGTKAVDARADLWSLAVVIFRAVTGELPFRSEALGDLLIKIVMHPLPVPSHVAPGIPPGFDDWWLRAAQREPDHRFQSAKALVEGLRQVLTGPGAVTPTTGSASWGGAPLPQAGSTQYAGATPWPTGGGLPFAPAAGSLATPSDLAAAHAAGSLAAGQSLGPGGAPFGQSYGGAVVAAGAAEAGPYARGATVLAPAGSVPIGLNVGDSGSGPSVAGFATQATGTRATGRRALIGALIASGLAVGAAVTVGVYLSMAPASADESTPAAVAPDAAAPDSTAAASSAAPPDGAPDAGGEISDAAAPSSATAPDASASASTTAEPAPTRSPAKPPGPAAPTTAGPKTPPIATTLDVGPPPPKPKPKPTEDLGF